MQSFAYAAPETVEQALDGTGGASEGRAARAGDGRRH